MSAAAAAVGSLGHRRQEGAAARQQFKANDPAIWLAPAILGLPFFMPLLVMVFEFVVRYVVPPISDCLHAGWNQTQTYLPRPEF
mmetsp:Transcript_31735/g.46402  ORF Transcript_31735/g.46402 Transcript_31735/m.46402 type:complete len:84 (+) Transcript_31735:97-348(+)|eukprot:CAMPEP_0179451572 /NCGR_PEP_ID=MMETSP0799-20121207/35637_1 /TAXON_ID=46947 /ORGANISM="Geminigera cryophila, Strain CCMP2564" /LENGTH=83 /DNA_ID=CAMNT_0021246987 /DNA_START=97 /DNA_END=348 /DNA_ORIENTATION=+